jgi:Putative transposase
LQYLGAYTHRVAISNHRLVYLEDGNVTFRWRDSAHGNKKKLMTLPVDEFLRRFLLHLLPRGFVRIRHFGFLANRRRANLLPVCFQLLRRSTQQPPPAEAVSLSQPCPTWCCPVCGGSMRIIDRISAAELLLRSPPQIERCAAWLFPISTLLRAPAHRETLSYSPCSSATRPKSLSAMPEKLQTPSIFST